MTSWRHRSTVGVAALMAVTSGQFSQVSGFLLMRATGAQSPRPAASCTAPEYRQFDFWVGDWDTYQLNNRDKTVARNRVDLILDGCVVREVYEAQSGLTGQSFSMYDASRHVWHQSWVTNRGELLVLEGGLDGDRMVLTGRSRGSDGGSVEQRVVWQRAEGGVRETAETSSDRGKTWKPVFDLVFRTHVR